MQGNPVYAFTTASPVTLFELTNECEVTGGWDPDNPDEREPGREKFTALWDTGATNSVISQVVVDACELLPIGFTEVFHVDGSYLSEVYLVNITLPSDFTVSNLSVAKADIPLADILVGMDIISLGDFAISNQNGGTKFTFRIPSIEDIDFAADLPI